MERKRINKNLSALLRSFTFWFIIIGIIIVLLFNFNEWDYRDNVFFSPVYSVFQLLEIPETEWISSKMQNGLTASYGTTSPIYTMIPIIAFTSYGIILDIVKVMIKKKRK